MEKYILNSGKILLYCPLFLFLFGCAEIASFSEPQPVDAKNLSKLPSRIQGSYLSVEDSSLLLIGANHIQRLYNLDYTLHIAELDSTLRLNGDTLINIYSLEKIPVKRFGDSILCNIRYTDTLFSIGSSGLLRKYKGYYFLNNQTDYDSSWVVKKMQLKEGKLSISSLSSQKDIEILDELTETAADTAVQRKYSVTKKQFKEFVKKDGFSEGEIFLRIN